MGPIVHHVCILLLFKKRFVTPPSDRGAEYCDERVCLCVFVCPRSYLRNYTSDLHQFLCVLPIAVARSSGGTAIRYVFPVLWMTSYLRIPYAALSLARRNTRCRQRTLGTTSCSQGLLGRIGRVELFMTSRLRVVYLCIIATSLK